MRSSNLVRPSLALLLAAGLSTLATPAGTAQAAPATMSVSASDAAITVGYLLTADLRKNKVSLDLLQIADGEQLTFAVPSAQLFGPGLAPGTSTGDVFGVGANGRARLDTLILTGDVRSRKASTSSRWPAVPPPAPGSRSPNSPI